MASRKPVIHGRDHKKGGVDPLALALDDLTDVDTTGKADGDVLTYNSTTGEWDAESVPGSGGVVNGPSVEIAQLAHGFVVGDVLRLDPDGLLEQVAFVASAQTTDPTVVAGSLTADVPAGLASGDVLYLKVDWINQFVGLDNSAAATGFTSIGMRAMDNFGVQVLRRVLDGSEAYIGSGGTVSVSMSGTDATHNQIACFAIGYRGVSNASPEETLGGTSTTDATTDGYTDTYTTTTDGQVIIQALFVQPITTDFAPVAPSGTLRQNHTDWAAPWATARSVWHESDTILAASGQAVEMDWSNAEYGSLIFGLKHAGTGSPYVKAQADSADDAEVVGIVTEVIDADHFIMTLEGRITGLAGLSAGSVYFLSETTAGALTDTEPSGSDEVSKPLLVADSPTSGYFYNWRGKIIDGTDDSGSAFAAGSGGASGSGTQLDYVERTTALTVTATTAATAQAFIDGTAVTYDGATRIRLEFFCNNAEGVSGTLVPTLFDGSTQMGWLAEVNGPSATPIYCVRYLTPSAGAHTYHVKAWKTGGTCFLTAGSGGSGADSPSFLRISQA